MGTPRTRERLLTSYSPGSYESGYYSGAGWVHLGNSAGSSLQNIQERCADTLGPGPPYVEPHGLSIIHRKCVPLAISGEAGGGFSWRRHASYNPTNYTGYMYAVDPGPTDWNYWKAKALASINPFSPQVDLPLFLFELREFPRMLRDLGNVLRGRVKPADVPGGYLAYQFGWRPLVSDLSSLLDFAGSINKAGKALQNAANGGRVSHSLGSKSSSVPLSTYDYAVYTGTYKLSQVRTTKVKAWCTARVHLTDSLPPTLDERQMLYLRTAFGLNFRPAMIWDAIPWTWLIDYFTNIGDLMEARAGYGKWRFTDLYVMVRSTLTDEVTGTAQQLQGLSYSGGKRISTRKERSYVGSNPNVGFGLSPLLTGYQAGILGSLLTASALRSRR